MIHISYLSLSMNYMHSSVFYHVEFKLVLNIYIYILYKYLNIVFFYIFQNMILKLLVNL